MSIELLLEHPVTAEEVAKERGCSYKSASEWLRRKAKRGEIYEVGRIVWKTGRPVVLYCKKRMKGDQLKHESLITKFWLNYHQLGLESRRWMDVDQQYRADLEFEHNGRTFYVEMDRGTENLKQVTGRLARYRTLEGRKMVLFITTTEKRATDVLHLQHGIAERLLVTTLEKTQKDPFGEIWLGVDGWTGLRITPLSVSARHGSGATTA